MKEKKTHNYLHSFKQLAHVSKGKVTNTVVWMELKWERLPAARGSIP